MKGVNLKEKKWSTVSIVAEGAIKIRPEESPLVGWCCVIGQLRVNIRSTVR